MTDRRPPSWWVVVALCFLVGDVAGFLLVRSYPWLVLSLAAALGLAIAFALLRPTRWEVVLRGNSATNEGEVLGRYEFFTRWGARQNARQWNEGPTGTGILVARVERARRG